MKTNALDSAFNSTQTQYDVDGTFSVVSTGLTKREYFAAAALQAILADNSVSKNFAAFQAVACADCLIEELNK